jgi:hypothetical protein
MTCPVAKLNLSLVTDGHTIGSLGSYKYTYMPILPVYLPEKVDGNAVYLYSGCIQFESRSGQRLSPLRIFLDLLSAFRQPPGQYLN